MLLAIHVLAIMRRVVAGRKRHGLLVGVVGLMLARVFLLLPLLVVREVVEDRRRVLEAVNDFHHLNTVTVGHLLRVTRVRHRLVLIVLQADVSQLRVRHVLDVDPLDAKRSLPLVLRPDARIGIVVDRRDHLSDAAEVARAVNGEEKVNDAVLLLAFAECLIQALVAVLRRAPNLVFDAAVNVVLRVGFDDKESKMKVEIC